MAKTIWRASASSSADTLSGGPNVADGDSTQRRPLQFPGGPCSSGGSKAGPVMPASGIGNVVGAAVSVLVAPVGIVDPVTAKGLGSF
jgi:hypothetical protein